MTRCLLLSFYTCLFFSADLRAQTEIVRSSYFPAEQEFSQLTSILEDRVIPRESVKELADGKLYAEAGFQKYAARTYTVSPSGRLRVEIVTLKDAKAAYSLLTLLRPAAVRKGPPGDSFSSVEGSVILSQSNILSRISSNADGDLAERVARSVSNRIGRSEPEPSLVSNLPKRGLDPSSLRYFLGPTARTRSDGILGMSGLDFQEEVEIAQARYVLDEQRVTVSLVAFPTSQSAEEFFSDPLGRIKPGTRPHGPMYLKKAGPLLGLLEGDIDPARAESLLGEIQFRYSIKWIFDRSGKSSGGFLSASTGIMGTVVRSLLFTIILCVLSILGGISLAAIRLTLRGYAPGNYFDRPERTEMIRLKINES